MPSPPSIEPEGYPLEELGDTGTDATPTTPGEGSMPSPSSAGPQGHSPEEPHTTPAGPDNDATTATPVQPSMPTSAASATQDHSLEEQGSSAPAADATLTGPGEASMPSPTSVEPQSHPLEEQSNTATNTTPITPIVVVTRPPSTEPQGDPIEDLGNTVTNTIPSPPSVAVTPEAARIIPGYACDQNSSNRTLVTPRMHEEGRGQGLAMGAIIATSAVTGSHDQPNNGAWQRAQATCRRWSMKLLPYIRWPRKVHQYIFWTRALNPEIGSAGQSHSPFDAETSEPHGVPHRSMGLAYTHGGL